MGVQIYGIPIYIFRTEFQVKRNKILRFGNKRTLVVTITFQTKNKETSTRRQIEVFEY